MDAGGSPLRRTRTWAATWPLLIALVALGLRWWAPGPVSQTFDERSWSARSITFRQAVMDGDFDDATAAPEGQLATMPGITTMWSGTVGWYLADAGTKVGLVDETARGAPEGTAVLRASRAVVSLACASVLWACIVMASLLWGRRPALVLGALLAVEPWLVGHSGVLHTDAFVTMFGFAGFLAFALCGTYLEARLMWRGPKGSTLADLPVVERWYPRAWAVVAGGFFGLALLTKVNAVVVVVGTVIAVPLGTLVGPMRRREARLALRWRSWAVMALVAVGTATLVVIACWPALWTSPLAQWRLVVRSASQVGDPNDVFFAGRSGAPPGAGFYPVAVAFRFSPWLVLGSLGAVVISVWRRALRGPSTPALRGLAPAGAAVCMAYLVAIATADKVYDRYALVFVPFLATVIAVVGVRLVDDLRLARPGLAAGLRSAAVASFALAVVYVLVLAPYSISYASPLSGGQRAARRWIPLGWGEGIERAGQVIERRDGDRCDEIEVSSSWPLADAVPCGRTVGWEWTRGEAPVPDYAIVYVLATQRGLTPAQVDGLARYGREVDRVSIGGVTYVELWALDDGT